MGEVLEDHPANSPDIEAYLGSISPAVVFGLYCSQGVAHLLEPDKYFFCGRVELVDDFVLICAIRALFMFVHGA